MSYQLLETLQSDVISILRATPDLQAANIIAEQNGDLESEVERMLGLTKSGSGGKRGLVCIVMLPEVIQAEANLPGPPFVVKQEIQVIEHPRINRGPAGTGLRSSHAALLALHSLHQHSLGGHATYADEKPIEPLPARDGLISHVLTLYARANGLTGPGKPAQVSAAVTEGGTVLRISGSLSPDITGDLPFAGLVEGYPVYSSDGEISTGLGTVYPRVAVYWDPDEQYWRIHYEPDDTGSQFADWTSYSAVASPELATGWTTNGYPVQNSGTPLLELASEATLTLTCATAGASIRYTTDGSYPDATNGTLYTAPIPLPESGTVIRAAAYATGLNPGDCTELTVTE